MSELKDLLESRDKIAAMIAKDHTLALVLSTALSRANEQIDKYIENNKEPNQ